MHAAITLIKFTYITAVYFQIKHALLYILTSTFSSPIVNKRLRKVVKNVFESNNIIDN